MKDKNSSKQEVLVDPFEKTKIFFNADDREKEINFFIKNHNITYFNHSEAHNWQGADHVVIVKYRIGKK